MSVCLSVRASSKSHFETSSTSNTPTSLRASHIAVASHLAQKMRPVRFSDKKHAIDKALQFSAATAKRNAVVRLVRVHVCRPHIDYSCETCREIKSTKSLLALELMGSDDCSLQCSWRWYCVVAASSLVVIHARLHYALHISVVTETRNRFIIRYPGIRMQLGYHSC